MVSVDDATGFHLAQFNTARAVAPIDHAIMAPFMARLDEINRLAENALGFVWRLQDDSGNSTAIQPEPDLLINLSVWRSAEALFDFTYRSDHKRVMAQRREWFRRHDGPHLVLWWVPAGTLPDVDEGLARLDHLCRHGPTPHAFDFKTRFDPPAQREVA